MQDSSWLVRLVPLGVVGLLVWFVRARNIVTDPTGDQRSFVAVAPVVVFVVMSVGVLVVAWRAARRGALQPGERLFVLTSAAASAGWWLMRSIVIIGNDHSVAFTVVHLLLAAVTIGASVWAVLGIRTTQPAIAAG